jgi:hypothetical protein
MKKPGVTPDLLIVLQSMPLIVAFGLSREQAAFSAMGMLARSAARLWTLGFRRSRVNAVEQEIADSGVAASFCIPQ